MKGQNFDILVPKIEVELYLNTLISEAIDLNNTKYHSMNILKKIQDSLQSLHGINTP